MQNLEGVDLFDTHIVEAPQYRECEGGMSAVYFESSTDFWDKAGEPPPEQDAIASLEPTQLHPGQ